LKRLSCEEFDAFESTIDTIYFGIPSAIVVLKKACSDSKSQTEILDFLQDFEFITITNKGNNPLNNRWLGERTRAFLTDVNIQFSKRVSLTDKHVSNLAVIADNLSENHQIIHITESAFEYSRFLNDPYLLEEKARHIYGDIVKNAFNKTGRFFVTISTMTVITGFLLFSIDYSALASKIELVAIDKEYHGRGIGRLLIGSMEHYLSKRGVETIQVGTQLNNINALNFYESCGFSILECNSIYHYWPSKI
jgi:dTDP-4-amino-4,6-dideoxy-D-galactose acyltransferase